MRTGKEDDITSGGVLRLCQTFGSSDVRITALEVCKNLHILCSFVLSMCE